MTEIMPDEDFHLHNCLECGDYIACFDKTCDWSDKVCGGCLPEPEITPEAAYIWREYVRANIPNLFPDEIRESKVQVDRLKEKHD